MSPVTATESERGERPTRIYVELAAGRARFRTLDQGYFLAGRPLGTNGSRVRMALVGVHLAMLGGDVVDLRLEVGAGVTLEVIEPTGMVAYDADGRESNWNLSASVGAGATLIWRGAEFVAAQGSNAKRNTELELAADARVLIKETLVLGRSGESEIHLGSRMCASLEEQELLVEEFVVTPQNRRLPGIVGSAKVISTVTALGMRPGGDRNCPQRLDLVGPGALWRSLAAAAHSAHEVVEPVFNRWRGEALERVGS